MGRHINQAPTGWGKDPLTQYIDNSHGNQWATFANKRSEVIDLITIDGMFRRLVGDSVNPTPVPAGKLFASLTLGLSVRL